MQLESADDLLQALRTSGLFPPEQFEGFVRELVPAGTDAATLLKHLVRTERVTRYQLKKLIHGKTADLLVGPYVVSDKLGEGGMGKVFRARLGGTGDTVALKVVRAALVANPTVRGRYAREVQASSALDHPNIVRVLGAGEADGKFYMAMEFVDGIDLARMMRDYGLLEVAEACEYARQAALGLQHAHDRGFVHRDIKPSNIVVAGERFLPQATEPSVVKILDLGLARAIDPDDMVAPDLTRDHSVVGTPDYMAPEQAKNSKGVDPRADLYSLGCALYFLLTGRVPFLGKSAIEKILAHQSEMPPPLQALRPDVPDGVAQLVVRLMAKRPDDRPQTAAELVAALEPYARYPDGAPPVPIGPARQDVPPDATPPSASHPEEPTAGRSTLPPGLTSSVGSVFPLESPNDDAPAKAHPVAPSDRTPRPNEVRQHSKPIVRSSRSLTRRKPPTRGTPRFVWLAVLVALMGFVFVAFLIWAVAR
ncbi:serine/threonine-protein kinase [Frigoriglobus tundricola]|uniref:Protein kinase domain-containing protein n=1 Tax=Frigoriglobus tundricola TaxID=2774151 RepID=A0A6M5YF24_9BACT|nr:serine/threonine-protein kinase [Frigoriglobus tundricola]QJW92599.1 hypothetical protein FTUN_0096 [Frigoriglobus tundricola]